MQVHLQLILLLPPSELSLFLWLLRSGASFALKLTLDKILDELLSLIGHATLRLQTSLSQKQKATCTFDVQWGNRVCAFTHLRELESMSHDAPQEEKKKHHYEVIKDKCVFLKTHTN